jgi:hypothetical protein
VPPPRRAKSLAEERAQHPFLDFWLEQQTRPGSYAGHPLSVRPMWDRRLIHAERTSDQ